MIFGFGKPKPVQTRRAPRRSSARYGGMQVRELQIRLEILVDAALSHHDSVIENARALARLSLVEQRQFIASLERISLTDQTLALHFCQQAIPALKVLDDTTWTPWIDDLLSTYQNHGLDASVTAIQTFKSYQQNTTPDSGTIAFNEITAILENFIHAINGHAIKLASSEHSYTDTETLYLPPQLSHFKTRDANFRLYKAMAVHQWAQIYYGTWRINITESIAHYSRPERALRLFHRLETLRLDACLKRDLPGMAREMATLHPAQTLSPPWQAAKTALADASADAQTSLTWLAEVYALDLEPEVTPYQGQLRADIVSRMDNNRDNQEQAFPQKQLNKASNDTANTVSGNHESEQQNKPAVTETSIEPQAPEYPAIPLDSTITNTSIDDIDSNDNNEEDPAEAQGSIEHTAIRQYQYDEWDHARQRYRKNWCVLREQNITPVDGHFVDDTLRKYKGLLKHLRRSFEALRQEHQRLKREPGGDDIDIDAAVEAWSDNQAGLEASKHLFIHTSHHDRKVAVMFMIDMSASTAGWVNTVERESLVLLCEALEHLDDRYAIYGFSGEGSKHCQCFRIKDFNENYTNDVQRRIEGIQPQAYTRLGTAIRHLSSRLNQVDARTRLLITLTDGQPDDTDGYRGNYGIEDTRKALIETRHMGIHPFCITIDTDAREYMHHMYGETDFIIIKNVSKLPQQVADIYRRITT